MSSIISEKNSTRKTSDKVENEKTNKQTRTGTNQRKDENKTKHIPHNYK